MDKEIQPVESLEGNIIIPPSPNWFRDGAVDSREADKLFVYAAFKTIVVYRINIGFHMPTLLKTFSHSFGKVMLVRIYPDSSDPSLQSYVLAASDTGAVTVYDCNSGAPVTQHSHHKTGSVGGLCWVPTGDGATMAVSVGGESLLVVWDVCTNVSKCQKITLPANSFHTMKQSNSALSLSAVEAVPATPGQVLVAANQDILLLDIKDGSTLATLRGHSSAIYSIKFCPSTPFSEDKVFFGKKGQPGRSDNGNWRNKTAEESLPPPAEKCSPSTPCNIFFASSDTGRDVFLWDLTTRRYVAKTNIFSKWKPKGNARAMPNHTAIAWYNSKLLANNTSGEVYSLSFWSSDTKSSESVVHPQEKSSENHPRNISNAIQESSEDGVTDVKQGVHLTTVHNEHSRLVFAIHVFGSLAVSVSQDRNIVGYCLATNKLHFSIPTTGGSMNTLAFCPHDSSWLALGLQDNCIKLVNLHSSPPFKSKDFNRGIKGKISALQWHPTVENKILFGTTDGQVGILDSSSGKINLFSYFHQKPVYKVGWAPCVAPNQGDRSSLYAYSFGDREVSVRDPSNFMANSPKLTDFNSQISTNISEFSFSFDNKYLALGCQDGEVFIVRTSDLKILLRCVFVHKTIQHILWRKESSTHHPCYFIAIASNDSKICTLDLDSLLSEQEKIMESSDALPESSDAFREPAVVTACTRELSGHSFRVVWLSFSPHNPDLLASASYDYTCQIWNSVTGEQLGNYRGHLSRVYRVEFSPSEAGLLYSFADESSMHQWRMNSLQHKIPPAKLVKPVDPKLVLPDSNAAVEKKEPPAKKEPEPVLGASRRTPLHKSLFPTLHKATCHKRSFYLYSVLCLEHHKKILDAAKAQQQEIDLEQLVEGDIEQQKESVSDSAVSYYEEVSNSFKVLLEEEEKIHPSEDIETFLDFYGPPSRTSSFLSKQIAHHMSLGQMGSNIVLQNWQGSTESLINSAILSKSLTADMVALAPQISQTLWLIASEAYANQLVEAGDPLSASTYLLNANKVEEAVELLAKHKLYREALVLAKARLPYSDQLLERVTEAFAGNCLADGCYDMATVLFSSIGKTAVAANSLCRRGDSSSLLVAGMLYQSIGDPLTKATFLECLKLCGSKCEIAKISAVIEKCPQFKWFGVIVDILDLFVNKLDLIKAPGEERKVPLHKRTYLLSPENLSLVDTLLKEWKEKEVNSQECYTEVLAELNTGVMPTSPKHFWFLASIEVSKLLLSSLCCPSSSPQHLASIVHLILDWGRTDNAFDLTHILFPSGLCDSSSPLSDTLSSADEEVSSLFKQVYYLSDFDIRTSAALEKNKDDATKDQDDATKDQDDATKNKDDATKDQDDMSAQKIQIIQLMKPLSEVIGFSCPSAQAKNLFKTEPFCSPAETVRRTLDQLHQKGVLEGPIVDELSSLFVN